MSDRSSLAVILWPALALGETLEQAGGAVGRYAVGLLVGREASQSRSTPWVHVILPCLSPRFTLDLV